MIRTLIQVSAVGLLLTEAACARGARPNDLGAIDLPIGAPGAIWYTTWETATAEAKRTNRPIFFMAAAHQCGNVSGTF